MCHGGSTTTAGDLDLTAAKAYQSLINVKAPHSAKGETTSSAIPPRIQPL